jgi:hypothetical protein
MGLELMDWDAQRTIRRAFISWLCSATDTALDDKPVAQSSSSNRPPAPVAVVVAEVARHPSTGDLAEIIEYSSINPINLSSDRSVENRHCQFVGKKRGPTSPPDDAAWAGHLRRGR